MISLIAVLIVPQIALSQTITPRQAIKQAAQEYKVSENLLLSICTVESGLRPHVINHDDGGSASIGLCQVKVATARWLGFKVTQSDLLYPLVNARAAAKYLNYIFTSDVDDVIVVIARYNAGSVKRAKDGRLINQRYVDKVMELLNVLERKEESGVSQSGRNFSSGSP